MMSSPVTRENSLQTTPASSSGGGGFGGGGGGGGVYKQREDARREIKSITLTKTSVFRLHDDDGFN